MNSATPSDLPVVLTIAGHDPSGGAGVQADIEAIRSMGCHPASVIACLTIQDTRNTYDLRPLDPDWVRRQAEAVLLDLPVAAVKLGALGSADVARSVAYVLGERCPHVPLVLDPVLVASGGGRLAGEAVVDVLRERLIPRATLLTPNLQEARRLSGLSSDTEACARGLEALGAAYVLITGADEPTEAVVNRLYGHGRLLQIETWPRLPGRYHGSGCTLASAAAALLARDLSPCDAAQKAQRYVWDTLDAGYRPGKGQMVPNRLFWITEPDHAPR